ncbi:MAG: hypothetical protein PVJ22_09600 [Desulfobacterales bacterium]|jgi:hypothetical protein
MNLHTSFPTIKKPSHILLLCVVMGLFFSVPLIANDRPFEKKLPDELTAGIVHLLEVVDPARAKSFQPELVSALLKFIEKPKRTSVLYFADGATGSPSAYYEFDLHRSLKHLLSYAFDPDIPDVALTPTSTRLSYWKKREDNHINLPRLSENLNQSDAPIVLYGLEFVEITPDSFSGAYYSYDNHRSFILFKYQNHKVLISISKQTDVSSVGKKGYVLGRDADWDYFYSGEPGLSISGLGWTRSYMYDSYGINIYYELDHNAPLVRCAILHWIRAGWSKINFVKRHHIYSGLKRFAGPFKAILESPTLPDADVMAGVFSNISTLSGDILKEKADNYFTIMKTRYGNQKYDSKKWPSDIFEEKGPWLNMNNEEIKALLAREYMKLILGKTQGKEVAALLDLKP